MVYTPQLQDMNWDYISGFFDADGSVTFSRLGNSKNKTIQISFTNVELSVLEKMREFIEIELDIKGFISTKAPRKSTHKVSYQLNYNYFNKCIKLIDHIKSLHPKKLH